jgi:glycosyltransferase involved in cell wall biosynthesis
MRREGKDIRVAYLTNNVNAHSMPLLRALSTRIKDLLVLTSTAPEQTGGADSAPEGKIRIIQQRNISLRRVRRHPQGYSQSIDIHIPYETFFQLLMRRPDVVISLEFGIRTLQALLYRIFRPSSRLIVWAPVSERTEQARGILRTILRKGILKIADAVLVNGASGLRYIRGLGTEERKIHTVPYTTDAKLFGSIPPSRSRHHATRLLYVGQLIELKGLLPFLDTLIQWAECHPTKKIEWVLIGEGPLRTKFRDRKYPPNIVISILGKIPYLNLPPYYAKADIFVFPTLGDEWGLVVNEAMMTGLPVLGSVHSQAVEELVEDGTNGWIFDSEDPRSRFHALDRAFGVSFENMNVIRVKAREASALLTPDYAADQIVLSLKAVGCP